MPLIGSQRFLVVYSSVLTITFVITVFSGFATRHKRATFEEIDVQRINLVEPDGSLRMVLSDKTHFPGSYIRGKEFPRSDRHGTGMIFIDDEGTEMGGIMWGASRDKNGKVESNGHLSFDQYMQDQIFSIDAGENAGKRYSAISISDHGDYPITEAMDAINRIRALPEAQRAAEREKFISTHPGDYNRITLARMEDKSVVLRMRDPEGRERLLVQVGANGSPVIKFLDANGKIIEQLPK